MIELKECEKCRSRLFLIDETITYLEINGEVEKELGRSGFFNRNCLKCTMPEIYHDFKHLDKAHSTSLNDLIISDA